MDPWVKDVMKNDGEGFHISVDGTFKTSPTHWAQQFTVMVRFDCGRMFPLFYAILPRKNGNTYERFFAAIEGSLTQDVGSCMMDFEYAVRKAFEGVFGKGKVVLCYFHFCQNIRRKFESLIRKPVASKEQQALREEVYYDILALPFLPLDLVDLGMDFICDKLSGDDRRFLLKYLRPYYGMKGIHPARLWNLRLRVEQELPRTNNGQEGFHNRWNGHFPGSSHPTIWSWISVVHDLMKETRAELLMMREGEIWPREARYLENDAILRRVCRFRVDSASLGSWFDKVRASIRRIVKDMRREVDEAESLEFPTIEPATDAKRKADFGPNYSGVNQRKRLAAVTLNDAVEFSQDSESSEPPNNDTVVLGVPEGSSLDDGLLRMFNEVAAAFAGNTLVENSLMEAPPMPAQAEAGSQGIAVQPPSQEKSGSDGTDRSMAIGLWVSPVPDNDLVVLQPISDGGCHFTCTVRINGDIFYFDSSYGEQAKVSDYMKVWPLVMDNVEKRMNQMEQALIKRHNVKMMNEMQEVVRQITTAKTRNEEILLAYNTRLGEITRALTDLAEKQTSSDSVDDLKRQINLLRQHLNIRCGQTSEQVGQLKQSVIITLQRERTEMQQRMSQLMRNDLTMVIHQVDRRLKEGHAQMLALNRVVRELCSLTEGGEGLLTEILPNDEGSLPSLEPSKILNDNSRGSNTGGTSVSTSSFPRQQQQQQQQQTQPQGMSTTLPGFNRPQGSTSGAGAAAAATSSSSSSAMNINSAAPKAASGNAAQQAALTKRIAELIKRQGVNVSSQPAIAQLLAHLPQQQQQQLQQLLQQQQQQQQQQQKTTYGMAPSTGQQTSLRSLNTQAQQQQQQRQQRALNSLSQQGPSNVVASAGLCPFISTFGYMHMISNREPLRQLPSAMIAQLQQQYAAQVLSGQITTSAELMQAIANSGAAKQNQATTTTTAGAGAGMQSVFQAGTATVSTPSSSTSGPQHDLIASQIAHQQEGLSMGAKAKTISCKFNAVGKCAYGSRCAYRHAGEGAAVGGGNNNSSSNQPTTTAAILAAMAKETRAQQNAPLLTISQQQQLLLQKGQQQQQQTGTGRQLTGPGVSAARSSSEGPRAPESQSKDMSDSISAEAVTSAWLKDHLSGTSWAERLSSAKPEQPSSPFRDGGGDDGAVAAAAATPPSSPPPPEDPTKGSEDQQESEVNYQSSRNTVDFEEVVVKDEADEGVAESAGPPPGLGFGTKTESS
ncbi:hypothetical protein Pmar_PMAR017444 [Perkinsus marinus ATCC 50983]|uniref:C3H1-type domain-containing protein n=1 Tax=Perkinsus marinus (strain ATCC 50983 / TXsc) TaxID=423536 RepID=C5KFZ6_PERM5|nr:hypothetical protein Pmar_PMAR017444 [Perkinsus marinus ATCC 50983]EER16560.1 hypothetical protein Pmar_PMAR017444 [Perkinsus marinus ATCC 50983]|eukprot:XP_002784764.1 hypothetical protein Pmar_PMAR017444 [Perkinsus marinus ATCC 50983]